MPTLDAWGTSDPGLVRKNNEDSWALDASLHIAVVADGMGGASCGEVASALTVEGVLEHLRRAPFCTMPQQAIEEAIHQANARVLDKAHADESCAGMGSTVVRTLLMSWA